MLTNAIAPCDPHFGPAPILPRVRAVDRHCKWNLRYSFDEPLILPQGSGSAQPSGSFLTKFPGAYSMSDPGVGIDVYSQPVREAVYRVLELF